MTGPLFVGGTGRSGTTIVARVLGSDPHTYMIPIETRFIVDTGGLLDLIDGETSFAKFERLLRGRWWYRDPGDGKPRGLHSIVSETTLEASLEEFRESAQTCLPASARTFVNQLLDATLTPEHVRWIEMTPPNIVRGRRLVDLMGEGTKVVHSIRDGRDVAASVATKNWGPGDIFEALDWWGERMAQGSAGCEGLDPTLLHVVQLEDLVVRDRAATVERLAAFAGVEPAPMQSFIDRFVTAERAHIGRWTDAVEPSQRPDFDARYDAIRDRLTTLDCPVPL